jgi:hypothetical protein
MSQRRKVEWVKEAFIKEDCGKLDAEKHGKCDKL